MNGSDIWGGILYPLATVLIPVLATIYTLNMRLKNENREKHQPYLILDKIEPLFHINKNKYFLTIINESDTRKVIESKLDIIIKNIGYGVATNIKFYNLGTGLQIDGSQEIDDNVNQQLFTTFDIACAEEKKVQLLIDYNNEKRNLNRILCIYQDLNHNVYDFIVAINLKKKNKFDYFSYQPSSLSYQRWIRENKSHYQKIIKKYKNL